jgi:hypothetical protein
MTDKVETKSNRLKLLAILSGLLPYVGGFLVLITRNILWLAFAGVLICGVSTTGAYIVRRSRDPVSAKYWLLVEPILFGTYFVFVAVTIRYMFLHK